MENRQVLAHVAHKTVFSHIRDGMELKNGIHNSCRIALTGKFMGSAGAVIVIHRATFRVGIALSKFTNE